MISYSETFQINNAQPQAGLRLAPAAASLAYGDGGPAELPVCWEGGREQLPLQYTVPGRVAPAVTPSESATPELAGRRGCSSASASHGAAQASLSGLRLRWTRRDCG